MTEVKVSFYLKRNEEKQDGTVPILGRIRIGKSMVQFSAKVSVPVSFWDTTSGRAIGKSKTALSVNASLNKICVAIHSAYRNLLAKEENVSATDVKNAFQGIASEQDTLVKYYEAHNEQFLKNVGVNRAMETYKRYGISLNHLKRFMRKKYNVSDMSFQALTPSFVVDYDYYLRVDLHMASQTIVCIIGQLRRIVKIAINNGLIRNDPFIDYEFITSPIVPKSLTSAELKKMMKAKLSKPYLGFVRDMFLFSSFTGIEFGDMRNLTEKNLSTAEDGVRWINLKRKKTGTPCHIPLLEIPLQLIEKYILSLFSLFFHYRKNLFHVFRSVIGLVVDLSVCQRSVIPKGLKCPFRDVQKPTHVLIIQPLFHIPVSMQPAEVLHPACKIFEL
jgi:integrase